MTSQALTKKRSWSIAAGVGVVIVIGALVGTKAGNLAHRAPRGSGVRVAVLDTSGTHATARDAVVRDLAGVAGVTVIPPRVLAGKQRQMIRGGIDDATEAGAAEVLDADVVIEPTDADPARAIAAARTALQAAAKLSAPTAQAPIAAITADAEAYAAFLEGERKAQGEGDLLGSLAHYEAAVARDPAFAEAWAGLALALFLVPERPPELTARLVEATRSARAHAANLRPVASLVVDALQAWQAHDEGAADLKVALREPAIAACRALTVQFPEERNGHLLLGRAYRELFNGPSEGLRHLESARRLTPEYFPITHHLVVGWLQLADRKHATQALRAFLSGVPDHPEASAMLKALDSPVGVVRPGPRP